MNLDPVCNDCGCRKPDSQAPCPCWKEKELNGVCSECQSGQPINQINGKITIAHHHGPHNKPCNGIGTQPEIIYEKD